MKKYILFFSIFTLSSNTVALNSKDLQLYGKVSLVSSIDLQEGSQSLGDNSSRVGIKYEQADVFPGWTAGLRAEWSISTNRNNSGFGTNSFNGKQYDVVSNGGPFGNRLGYLWLKREDFEILAGKAWSTFYDVPEYTDILITDGARASSAYTRTGEVDGTYRASEIIQARYKYKDFHFALQTKLTGKDTVSYDFDDDGTPESTLVYKQAQSGSIQYIRENITLGVSALNLIFDNNGVDESQLSLSYGFKLNIKQFFLNAVYTRAKDLELTADNRFVHSDGTEAILGYHLNSTSNALVGINHQSRSESGDFDLLYYYVGYSKDFNKLSFAAEYIIGDSVLSNGSEEKESKLKLAATLHF